MSVNGINVLVVDDDDLFLKSIHKELDRMGYRTRIATNSKEALSEIRAFPPDVILLDIRLPDQDGLHLLRTIKSRDPSAEVIMLTAYGSVDTAVESLQAGAYHYLVKPAKLREIDAQIRKAYEKKNLKTENRTLKRRLAQETAGDVIVGSSRKLNDLLTLVERVAPTDQTVLIQGESGTGKELIAKRIHRLSSRRGEPFVLVDCASLNKSLLETELFGHERGAFTGAVTIKHGLIEAADGGTLFVDEIGCLDPEMQSDFLRLLETGEYRRVGGTEVRRADLRIVSATNSNLSEAVRQGKFREDLFFRLSVIVLQVPPLRERKEDIPLLAEYLLQRARLTGKEKSFSKRAVEHLQRHEWPGNVRELRNVIERAYLLSEQEVIEPWDLHPMPFSKDRILRELLEDDELVSMREMQLRYIQLVLDKVKGQRSKAAAILEIDPKTIYRNLRKPNTEH